MWAQEKMSPLTSKGTFKEWRVANRAEVELFPDPPRGRRPPVSILHGALHTSSLLVKSQDEILGSLRSFSLIEIIFVQIWNNPYIEKLG